MIFSSGQSPATSLNKNSSVDSSGSASVKSGAKNKGRLKRFGLSKKERIKSKKVFDLIYSAGEHLISPSQKLKALYLIDSNSDSFGIKTAYVVSKKAGNAVWRNRVKRLMRESFRLNKEHITAECNKRKIKLLVVFSAYTINQRNKKKIFLNDVQKDLVDLINQLITKM